MKKNIISHRQTDDNNLILHIYQAFSLAELMIVMLILTIILAATMPILSKRAKVKAAAVSSGEAKTVCTKIVNSVLGPVPLSNNIQSLGYIMVGGGGGAGCNGSGTSSDGGAGGSSAIVYDGNAVWAAGGDSAQDGHTAVGNMGSLTKGKTFAVYAGGGGGMCNGGNVGGGGGAGYFGGGGGVAYNSTSGRTISAAGGGTNQGGAGGSTTGYSCNGTQSDFCGASGASLAGGNSNTFTYVDGHTGSIVTIFAAGGNASGGGVGISGSGGGGGFGGSGGGWYDSASGTIIRTGTVGDIPYGNGKRGGTSNGIYSYASSGGSVILFYTTTASTCFLDPL